MKTVLHHVTNALLAAMIVLGMSLVPADDANAAPASQSVSQPRVYGPTWDRTPVCLYEDGSGQPRCVWDARHNGNGVGRSVVIVNGGEDNARVRYVSHKRAHYLATTNA